MKKEKKQDHYRITIDVYAEYESNNRISDIEHELYMSVRRVIPSTVRVRMKDLKYKVERMTED